MTGGGGGGGVRTIYYNNITNLVVIGVTKYVYHHIRKPLISMEQSDTKIPVLYCQVKHI